jgi:hypothetical protein
LTTVLSTGSRGALQFDCEVEYSGEIDGSNDNEDKKREDQRQLYKRSTARLRLSSAYLD